jgi:hypothetical protein
VGIQAVLGFIIFLVVLSAPNDPHDEGVLGLVKAVFVGAWVVSAWLLVAAWARRSRWIIVVAVAAFTIVWIAGTVVATRIPYFVSFPYGP